MANLQRLLTRRPRIDEAEVEDVRERTMARLAGLNGGGTPEPAASVATAKDPAPAVAETTGPIARATPPETVTPKPAGPKVIVPRSISLGPSQSTSKAEPHRTPPIIVTGDVEPTPVGAIVEAAEASVEVEAIVEVPIESKLEIAAVEAVPAIEAKAEPVVGTTIELPAGYIEPAVAIEGVIVVEEIVVAEAAISNAIVAELAVAKPPKSRASKPKARAKTSVTKTKTPSAKVITRKTPSAKVITPKTPSAKVTTPKTTRPAPKRASKPRPAQAIPVVAQPTPVIDPDAVWPGRWLSNVSREEPVAAELDAEATPAGATLVEPTPAAPPAAEGSDATPEVEAAPEVIRRDTSIPVARVALVADVGDRTRTAAAAMAVAEPAVAVAEPIVAVAEPAVAVTETAVVVADTAMALIEVPTVSIAEPAPATLEASPPEPAVRTPRKRPVAPRPTVQVASPAPTANVAFCPYCAFALDPAPTASRRCTRCRQRIVVKHVQGRVVYLTEAAVQVFDSERVRSANFGRWSKERAQWLKLAASVQADAARIGRLDAAPLSEKVVASARTLYTATAEHQFREAKREDRWEDASRLKREQAAAMHRLAGSPVPPATEVVALHREAVATELRGIGKMAKDAGLVGSDCCDACRADDGRTYRIAAELKTPRLPHEGCPKGLCHCRWDLNIRDRTMVQRYLRRTIRAPWAKHPSD